MTEYCTYCRSPLPKQQISFCPYCGRPVSTEHSGRKLPRLPARHAAGPAPRRTAGQISLSIRSVISFSGGVEIRGRLQYGTVQENLTYRILTAGGIWKRAVLQSITAGNGRLAQAVPGTSAVFRFTGLQVDDTGGMRILTGAGAQLTCTSRTGEDIFFTASVDKVQSFDSWGVGVSARIHSGSLYSRDIIAVPDGHAVSSVMCLRCRSSASSPVTSGPAGPGSVVRFLLQGFTEADLDMGQVVLAPSARLPSLPDGFHMAVEKAGPPGVTLTGAVISGSVKAGDIIPAGHAGSAEIVNVSSPEPPVLSEGQYGTLTVAGVRSWSVHPGSIWPPLADIPAEPGRRDPRPQQASRQAAGPKPTIPFLQKKPPAEPPAPPEPPEQHQKVRERKSDSVCLQNVLFLAARYQSAGSPADRQEAADFLEKQYPDTLALAAKLNSSDSRWLYAAGISAWCLADFCASDRSDPENAGRYSVDGCPYLSAWLSRRDPLRGVSRDNVKKQLNQLREYSGFLALKEGRFDDVLPALAEAAVTPVSLAVLGTAMCYQAETSCDPGKAGSALAVFSAMDESIQTPARCSFEEEVYSIAYSCFARMLARGEAGFPGAGSAADPEGAEQTLSRAMTLIHDPKHLSRLTRERNACRQQMR